MKDSTHEWVEKAEADFSSAGREYRARKHPNFDAACFFAQQCVEKYFKARLVEEGIPFPRTHDLDVLLDQIVSFQPLWEAFRAGVSDLTSFAVAFRYPGESATQDMARLAVANAKQIREQIRTDMFMG
jgi:HEPN domain-containing protein